MHTLITYPAGYGAFSYSPFCIKAAWLLNKAGVTWSRQDENDPRKYPNGKLPALKADGQLVPDSDGIRQYLEAQGADFWDDTSPRDKAIGHAMIRMAEEHMYFYCVIDRWMNNDVWPHIRDAYFKEIPRVIRGVVTGKLRGDLQKSLTQRGLMRLSEMDRAALFEADLQAIAAMLDGRDFLLGDTATLPDFSVAAMLMAIHTGPIETVQTRRISEDPVLKAYIDRMEATYG